MSYGYIFKASMNSMENSNHPQSLNFYTRKIKGVLIMTTLKIMESTNRLIKTTTFFVGHWWSQPSVCKLNVAN